MKLNKSVLKEVLIPNEIFVDFYRDGIIAQSMANLLKLNPGEYCFVLDSDNNKAVTINIDNNLILMDSFKNKTINGFSPKDLLQTIYFNLLEQESMIVVAALGPAGTGKTTVALTKAIADYFSDRKKIYLCKPTHLVKTHENQVFGPVPGDMQEKYTPYLGSFEIILNKMLGSDGGDYLKSMIEKKHIEFMPVEFTRGCTFENCTFILDEAQNLSWHELKTVLSRIGEKSKIILCGDPNQIDANFKYIHSGLYTLLNSPSFKSSTFTSKVELKKQYRGRIPDLIYNIDKELIKDNQ